MDRSSELKGTPFSLSHLILVKTKTRPFLSAFHPIAMFSAAIETSQQQSLALVLCPLKNPEWASTHVV